MYLELFWYFPNPPNCNILTGCLTCVCDTIHWNGDGKSVFFFLNRCFRRGDDQCNVMKLTQGWYGVNNPRDVTIETDTAVLKPCVINTILNNSIASLGQLWFAAWSVTHSVKLRLWHSAMPFSKRSRCKRRAWVPRRECQLRKTAWTTSSPCRRHCFSTGYSRKFVAELILRSAILGHSDKYSNQQLHI